MNKTVFSVLAALAASSLGHASETEDWLGLDKELESFRSNLATPQTTSSVGFSGFFRTSFTWGDEADVSGFGVDNARLNFQARVEDFDIMFQYEASTTPQFGFFIPIGVSGIGTGVGGVDGLLDAYGAWNIQDEFKLTFGQFRPAVLHSSWLDENELFFYNRTVNGFAFAARDQGMMLSGNFEQLGWWVGLQNGADGSGDDFAYFGRVEFDAMGDGGGDVEGAMGASDEFEISVGGAVYVDDSLDEGTVWAVDAQSTLGAFSAAAEVVGYDESYSASLDSETSWSLQATFMVVPDEWELGVRYEDLAELPGADTNVFTAGVSHYLNGHNAKISANFSTTDADTGSVSLDTEAFLLGLTLGW